MIERTILSTSRDKVTVNRVPCQRRNRLVMASQNANIAHHPQIKYPRGLISRRSSKEVAVHTREPRRCDGVFVAVEGRQTAASARIPELNLVVLRSRNNQTLSRVPVARLDIPVVSGQCCVGRSGCKVENFESCVIGC